MLLGSIATAVERPNILFIISDDVGTQLGVYGDANDLTPNLDRIAGEGVRFDNAYVTAASCSPARGSMLTGLYPHQHGMMGLSHFGTERMHDDVPKITPELRQLGYNVGWIGKTHIVPRAPFEFDFYNEDLDLAANRRDVIGMNRVAEEFLDTLDGNEPFFLVMSYIDPHRGNSDDPTPYPITGNVRFPRVKLGIPEQATSAEDIVPMSFLGLDSPEIRYEQADFYGALERLDIGVGDLRERLEERGLWEGLHVVFVGDHGPDVTRGKMAVYESATKVPLLVRGPSATPGLVRDEFVSIVDLFPTFMGMAGAEQVIVDPRQTGKDLSPLLQPGEVPWREQIFTEYITHVPWYFYPRYTVREGDWKLIYNTLGDEGRPNPLDLDKFCHAYFEVRKPKYDGTQIREVYDRVKVAPKYELFNLAEDPYEFVNLADDPNYQEIRDHLSAAIQKWREGTGDPMLDPEKFKAQERKGQEFREEYLRRQREARDAREAAARKESAPPVQSFKDDFRVGASRVWTSPNNHPGLIGSGGMTVPLNRNGMSMTTPIAGGSGIGNGTVKVAAVFLHSAESAPHPIHWGVGFSSQNRKFLQNMDADTVSVRLISGGPNRGQLRWSVFNDGREVNATWSSGRTGNWAHKEAIKLSMEYDTNSGEAIARVLREGTGELLLEDRILHHGITGFRFTGFEMTNFPSGVEGDAGAVLSFEYSHSNGGVN
jgi:N-sulfoglucosamine sulfohydrolase